ncbi:hypothetical protein [Metasolibacillus sp.]|uniref:homing endonuclease associated repeat-containing protein n=1 Tax=Metasolibacillus sp. TaxID=2703680 RepID=UPI0025FEAF05|nr:hypothetical protein [Metasolibacillus sp.]MCT6925414.1 hypothetical protein [Metasolibacillus sp.]MCT6941559.1 hypothetical protein [Metasolibacillus sp.]
MYKYTNEDLLNKIREYHRIYGKIPRKRDIRENQAISKRFGSWNNAIELAGFKPTRKNWTKEEIIKLIDEQIALNGRPFTRQEILSDNTLFSYENFKSYFGFSYLKYAESLGYSVNQIRLVDKQYLKMDDEAFLDEISKELNRIKSNHLRTFDKKRKKGFPASRYILSRFRCNWSELLESLNLKANKKYLSKEDFVEWFLTEINKLETIPSSTYLIKNHSFFYSCCKKYFKNYTNMCKELNIDPPFLTPTTVVHNNEELLELYHDFYKKIGRIPTTDDLDHSSDIYNSDVFIVRFGTMNRLRDLANVPKIKKTRLSLITKKEVEEELKRIYKKFGKVTYKELENLSEYPVTTIFRKFNKTNMEDVWNEIHEKNGGKAK